MLDARARCQGVAKMQPGKGLHLVRREARRSSCRVLPLDLCMHRSDSSIILAHLLRPLKAECRVDPVGDARQPRTIVDRDPERAVEDPASIKNVVDLFVLEQAIGMDTRTGDIEPGAGKGIIRGQRRAEYIAEVGGGPGDRGRVDARQVALEAQIIDTSASSGGLPVRSPNPKREPFAAAQPYSQAATVFTSPR